MPYYHVLIESVSKITKETRRNATCNLSEETVREYIAKPFMDNEEFMFGGIRIDPDYVESIRIIETEKDLSEIAEEEMEHDDYIFALIRRGELGETVTQKFIKIPPKRKTAKSEIPLKPKSKDVFIVHGTDHEPLRDLKKILKQVGLNPIVLHEQASGSRTLAEKLEKYSNVGFAFVILTPDDMGASFKKLEKYALDMRQFIQDLPQILMRIDSDNSSMVRANRELVLAEPIEKYKKYHKPRARQNVILEFGYFMGLLGRDRVLCLYKGSVELPSDMHGICYVHFDNSVNEVKDMISKELREAGYKLSSGS